MAAAAIETNTATIRRFHDAVNTGDLELISETIDEVVERAWHQRTRLRARMTTRNQGGNDEHHQP